MSDIDANTSFAVRVDLDREATEDHKARAREVFETETVGVRGRYALDVAQLVEVATTIALSASGSALWDFLKWAAPRVQEYVTSELFPDGTVAVGIYRAEAAGLVWEIRHRSDQALGDYEAGVIINGVDTWELPPDTARVSINLIDQRIATFDNTGLHIIDLAWPGDAVTE